MPNAIRTTIFADDPDRFEPCGERARYQIEIAGETINLCPSHRDLIDPGHHLETTSLRRRRVYCDTSVPRSSYDPAEPCACGHPREDHTGLTGPCNVRAWVGAIPGWCPCEHFTARLKENARKETPDA